MKKLIFALIVCLTATFVKAQFTQTLVVSRQPPGSILSWTTKDLTYIVNNQTQGTRQAVIKSVLTLTDGTPVATTNLVLAKVNAITPGNHIFSAADVLPLQAMIFTGKFKTVIDRTGKLPAGDYNLCVQLVTPVDFIALGEQRCRTFTIASYQLPIPVMPANEEVLEAEKAQSTITFRWTPVSPRPAETVKYVVTVFEILDRQTPMQALRSNQPLLTKDIIGTTQFIWQPQLSFIKTKIWDDDTANRSGNLTSSGEWAALDSIDATRFIWTIQTLNLSGVPFGDGNINADGISEPNIFTVVKDRRKNKTGPPARTIYMDLMNKKKAI